MRDPYSPQMHAEAKRLDALAKCGFVGVRVTEAGVSRVPDGEGLLLQAIHFSPGVRGPVAHCLDRRYPRNDGAQYAYQIWSIGADGYILEVPCARE